MNTPNFCGNPAAMIWARRPIVDAASTSEAVRRARVDRVPSSRTPRHTDAEKPRLCEDPLTERVDEIKNLAGPTRANEFDWALVFEGRDRREQPILSGRGIDVGTYAARRRSYRTVTETRVVVTLPAASVTDQATTWRPRPNRDAAAVTVRLADRPDRVQLATYRLSM